MAVRVFALALALVQPRFVLRNSIDNPCVLQIALAKRARESEFTCAIDTLNIDDRNDERSNRQTSAQQQQCCAAKPNHLLNKYKNEKIASATEAVIVLRVSQCIKQIMPYTYA